MQKIVPLAIMIGLVASLAPPAAAFHGTAYQLTGTATFGPTGDLWNAQLSWSGNLGAGGQFRLTLVNIATGVALPGFTITGGELLPVVVFPLNHPACSALEVVHVYMGYDTQTGGKVFRVEGVQENCLGAPRNNDRYQHVEGFYGPFDLDLVLGNAFGTQWE